MPKTATVPPTTDSPSESALTDDDLELMTVAEVAKKLRVAPYKVYEFCRDGLLPCRYLSPKAIRIKPADLHAFIESRPTTRPEPANS